ncbi:MAG: hydrogenase, rane subunit 1-like protein (EchA-like) [Bacteroidetes bacterium]|nr:hydrogenase, rane subunit 1-like protein (EchA-like) [Bacteroidota bacterium]
MSIVLFSILLCVPLAASVYCGLETRRKRLETATWIASAITFGSSIWLAAAVLEHTTLSSPQGWFYADALSGLLALVVSGSSLVTALYSVGYFRRLAREERVSSRETRLFYALFNVFVFTMMFVLLANNLGFLWIGTEATTLGTTFLVALYDRERSLEAAWKYVIICSVGIALALFGIMLTYFSALHVVPSSANALNWSTLVSVAGQLDPAILKLAFVFILVGFGTKAGLAPMHTWKPDAYAEAPTPVSALMAAGLVNIALYALMRFHILVHRAVGGSFVSTLFIIFGLLSMGIVIPFVLMQRDYKRLLAYSSIEHVGIIVFALGIATPLAYFGALLHLVNNAIAKLLVFLSAGNIRLAYRSKIIHRVSGAATLVPFSATLFLVGMFAVTGWPPFGLFISEFTIVSAGFASGAIWESSAFIFFVTALFGGFIYYAGRMVLGPVTAMQSTGEADITTIILLTVLAVSLLVMGIWIPEPLRLLLHRAVLVFQQ